MNDLVSLVDWSRAQFALTAIYHWLFVPLTLGLAVIVGVMETIYYRTGDERWKTITKFWMTLFGVNFAIGIATGIILEFQFGIQLVQLQLVCRGHIRGTVGYRRYYGFFYGVHFYCCHVFRME